MMRDIGARAESSAYEVKSTELTVADFLIMEAPPHMWRRPLTLQVGGVEVRNTSTYVEKTQACRTTASLYCLGER